jgi:propionate CoA-transferase
LFYPVWPLNIGLIRATTADEFRNLSCEDEPISSSSLAIALAVKACAGTVIAQVKRLIKRGHRDVQYVKVPGVLIDRVVVAPHQMMSTDIHFDPAFLGGKPFDSDTVPRLPMGPEKVIARRAAREVRPGVVSIFGFGASSDAPLGRWQKKVISRRARSWTTTSRPNTALSAGSS